jgi:DnaJ homolog subfamily A member 2
MSRHATRVSCGDCEGTGKWLRVKDRCKKCKGKRLIEEKKMLEFWIERGMEGGEHIVLKGEADQVPGKETGDAVFVINETRHPVFTRLGHDLKATLHITLAEAVCGFSRVILTTLDGRGLKYTRSVTDGQVIKPKDIFKIVGEGMPVGKKSDEKGDLYLDVEIDFPQDGWMSDPSKLDLLRTLLSAPSSDKDKSTNGVPEVVDEVTLVKADPEDFGGDVGGAGWDTDSDGDSDDEHCTTQ